MFQILLRKWIVPLLLLWTLLAGLALAWRDSPTSDEGIHIASAYLALNRGEFRFDTEHPFLFKFATALPLFLIHPTLPVDDQQLWQKAQPLSYDSWREARQWTDEWLYQSANTLQLLIFLARLPAVLCLVGLVDLVYFLSREWFSENYALAAAFFTAFNPTLLAHGHLANTDVPVALALLACMGSLWWYAKKPNWQNALLVGLLAGVANLTKFSGIALVIIVPLWLLFLYSQKRQGRRLLTHLFLMSVVAWSLIWLQYLLPYLFHSGQATFTHPAELLPTILQHSVGSSGHLLFLLRSFFPQAYIKGLLLVLNSTFGGRPTYLLGQTYPTGTPVPLYFPVLWFLKTQLVGLFLLGLTVLAWLRHPQASFKKSSNVLLFLCFCVLAALTLANRLNIGIRHSLPLIVLASLAMAWSFTRLTTAWFKTILVVLYAVPVLVQFNSLLGFSNIFVQPPSYAYRYFNDSNLEWFEHSQDIAAFIRSTYPTQNVYSNYLPIALSYYHASVIPFDAQNFPLNGPIVLSATQLTSPEYLRFRTLTPRYVLGNYAFVFDLR